MTRATLYTLLVAMVAMALFTVSPLARASSQDDQVEQAFRATYVYHHYLSDDAITIHAKDGVVTLTGTVADDSHKSLAEDTAEGLPGVKSVTDKLTTKAEAAAANRDAWIGRKVKLALLFHRHVSGLGTTVAVKDGVVTLMGQADNQAQKELTTAYAKDIDGVKEVHNNMKLAPTPPPGESLAEKVDDASVTAQVKVALLTHRSTSAIHTDVTTKNGVVTLKGVAGNAAEKALVTKLVSDIHGVEDVDNLMTLAPAK